MARASIELLRVRRLTSRARREQVRKRLRLAGEYPDVPGRIFAVQAARIHAVRDLVVAQARLRLAKTDRAKRRAEAAIAKHSQRIVALRLESQRLEREYIDAPWADAPAPTGPPRLCSGAQASRTLAPHAASRRRESHRTRPGHRRVRATESPPGESEPAPKRGRA